MHDDPTYLQRHELIAKADSQYDQYFDKSACVSIMPRPPSHKPDKEPRMIQLGYENSKKYRFYAKTYEMAILKNAQRLLSLPNRMSPNQLVEVRRTTLSIFFGSRRRRSLNIL